MKYYSLNYKWDNDFDLCIEYNRVYSGNGMKPKTGDVIMLTTRLDDGTAKCCVGVVIRTLSGEEAKRPPKWQYSNKKLAKKITNKAIPEGWNNATCWEMSWDSKPKALPSDYTCVQGGRMVTVDKEKYLDLFEGSTKTKVKRDRATAATRRGAAAAATNKKVADARAEYVANMPAWLRDLQS